MLQDEKCARHRKFGKFLSELKVTNTDSVKLETFLRGKPLWRECISERVQMRVHQ